MAYHPAEQLPVYDFLAREFCVCDHWFCSVPGATMPNRCYAAAGTSNGLRDNIKPSRPYNVPSFVRHLKDDQWRWYSHDYVPTIWLLDPEVGLSIENVRRSSTSATSSGTAASSSAPPKVTCRPSPGSTRTSTV